MAEQGYITPGDGARRRCAARSASQRNRYYTAAPRELLLRLRQGAADRAATASTTVRQRRAEGLHDDRPASCSRRRARRSTASSATPRPRRRRSSRSTRATATSGRWPRRRDYGDSKFNLAAQGHRQPGSTFKVMVLMTALRAGVDPDSTTLRRRSPLHARLAAVRRRLRRSRPTAARYGGRDEPRHRRRCSPTTPSTRSSTLDLGPDDGRRDRARRWASRATLDGYPAEGLGGLTDGVSPLEMARRLRDDRLRRLPQQADRDPQGHVPRRPRRRPRQARPRPSVFADGVTYEATKILEKNVQARHRHRARRSAARPPARPARPTTSPTPGSSASRRTWSTVGLGRLPERRADARSAPGASRRRRSPRRSGAST